MTPRRRFAGVLETNFAPAVRFVTGLSEDCGPKRSADRGFTRPTKYCRCLGVPIYDQTVQIKSNKGIRSSLDNPLGPRVAFQPGTRGFKFSALTEYVGVGFHDST